MEKDFLGVGVSFPLRVENGKIAWSKYEESIKESIKIILGTTPGERVMRPDFGCRINELVFEPYNTSTETLIAFHIKEALLKWEPRIEVLNVNVASHEDEKEKLIVNIEYMIKTSNSRNNLVYPFYLGSV